MRKTVLISILFLTLVNDTYSQFYKEAFDRQYVTSDPTGAGASIHSGRGHSTPTYVFEIGNGQGTYQTLTGPLMQGLILMYRATEDLDYLNQFVINSKNVQDHRDNEMQGSNSGSYFPVFHPDIPNTYYDYWYPSSGPSRPVAPTWSMYLPDGGHLKWYASAVYSGEILFPMAQFIRLIQVEDPLLASEPCPIPSFINMGAYADWLEARVWQTISAHTDLNYPHDHPLYPRDVYKTVGGTTGFHKGIQEGLVEHNFATSMGRVFAELYDCTDILPVKNGLRGYLTTLKDNWINHAQLQNFGDGYLWRHKQIDGGGLEEISHGAYAVHMALLCHKYGITSATTGTPLYNDYMISRFVNTFLKNMYNEPLDIGPGIHWFGPLTEGYDPNNVGAFNDQQMRASGTWLPLSSSGIQYDSYVDYVDRDIFYITADFFLKRILGAPNGLPFTGTLPISLANQAYYYKHNEEILDPITVDRNPGPGSLWAGVEGGDIDNDGKDDIVGVRNSVVGAQIVAFTIETTASYPIMNEMTPLASATTGVLNYADVAVGNFDPSHLGDEIVSITNLNGHLFLHEYNAGSLEQLSSYTLASAASEWTGLASGDFIKGNGKEEFVAVRNLDGKFYMMQYDQVSGSIVGILNWSSSVLSPNWGRISCGDLDGDGYKDDIVAIENGGGKIYTFYYDDNTNSMVSGPIYENANPASNFTDVTCGKFCSKFQSSDDIIVHRSLDGDLFGWRIVDNKFESLGEAFFLSEDKMDILGAGNFKTNNAKDELVCMRNIDGDVFAFNVKSECVFEEPGPFPPPIRKSNLGLKTPREIVIYPNPNNGHFKIVGTENNGTVEIYNLFGQLVFTSDYDDVIDISELSNGNYIIKYKDSMGVEVQKIIKQ